MQFLRLFSVLLILGTILVLDLPGTAADRIQSVSIGFRGQCKLGYWVPVRVEYEGDLPKKIQLEVTLPDTDGLPATYCDPEPRVRKIGDRFLIQSLVKLGRRKGPARVVLRSDAGNGVDGASEEGGVLTEIASRVQDFCEPVDALAELYVSVGNPIDIRSAATIGGENDYQPATAAYLEDVEELGDLFKGLESIDGLLIETGAFKDRTVSSGVQRAIREWVENGGRLCLIGGVHLKEFLNRHPILAGLVTGKVLGSRRISSTSGMERTIKASKPVSGQRNRPFVATLGEIPGEVLLREGDDPVIVHQLHGFGHVFLVTVDLAEAPISDWSDRKSFVGHLVSLLSLKSKRRQNRKTVETRFGYRDFSGQLRAALDSFSSVTVVNFTIVAAIAILFICLIGPADYFLLRRFGKMEWTWGSFAFIVLLTCGLITWISYSASSGRLLCRQVEIVDIDTGSGLVRGSVWSHVYSPESRRYDISWKNPEQVSVDQRFGSWFGFPGEALGGMDNNSLNTNRSNPYQVRVRDGNISQFPINVRSTRGFHADWTGGIGQLDAGKLRIRRNKLTGRVRNPLDVELENVFVVYGRDVFLYRNRLKPGESFDVQEDATQRSFSDYLNQRKVKDLGTEATPWSISDTNLARILEIMMFYDRAGGKGYVNLHQRYLFQVDFSRTLGSQQAILVGRTPRRASSLVVDGKALDSEYEESLTCYRLLVPVDTSR